MLRLRDRCPASIRFTLPQLLFGLLATSVTLVGLAGCGSQKLASSGDAPPVILSWSPPADAPYGTPLTDAQLNASSLVGGSFVYQPSAGVVLHGGSQQLAVTFTPTRESDGSPITKTVVLNIIPIPSVLSWNSPQPMPAGTALTSAQLNAVSTVPGSFSYTPAPGTLLDPGVHQLTAVFTPLNTRDYQSSRVTTNIEVQPAKSPVPPQLSWTTPKDITYGTPLRDVQLNANTDAAGTIHYEPTLGTLLDAGTHQLTALFTPIDSTQYSSTTTTVFINVTRAKAAVTWSNPQPIMVGTSLGPNQLNATSTLSGSMVYSQTVGSLLPVGDHQLTVSFTPTEAQNYLPAQASVVLTVKPSKLPVQLSWPVPADVSYGTQLSPAQLNAAATVPGTFTYTPAAGAMLPAGNQQLTVTFTPSDPDSYASATSSTNLLVRAAQPTLTWPTLAPIQAGTALSNSQLDASASIPGTITYNPTLGTVLPSGIQQLTATFTPIDAQNYLPAQASVILTVQEQSQSQLTVTPAMLPLGQSTIVLSGGTFSQAATVKVGGRNALYVSAEQNTLRATIFIPPWQAGTTSIEVTDPALKFGSGIASGKVTSTPVTFDAAARFARQATMGPRPDVVLHIQDVGFPQFIQEQMQQPSYQYTLQPAAPTQWVRNTVLGNSVLRQRVALALSSFIVTSAEDTAAVDYAMWEHTLEQDAFGNFRKLITDTALNPCMGRFLNLSGNWASTSATVHPNQNFAREMMQLFTIGPVMLHEDGSTVVDANGNPVPSYTQDDVLAMSNVLTGWGNPAPVNPAWTDQGIDYSLPLVAFEQYHDRSSKVLFGSVNFPSGQTAADDMSLAFDAIFSHPNLPPFIATRLIGQLVTSNPSPDYVARISRVFEDNGQGVRGDLGAVVTAILLDPEARAGDSGTTNQQFGVLHDPMTIFFEALNGLQVAPNDDQFIDGNLIPAEQVFTPPSVFGYDSPTYVIPGTTTVSPAFQLLNDKTLIGESQLLNAVSQEKLFVNWSTGPSWLDTNFTVLPDYVEAINHLFFSGRLTATQTDLITSLAATTPGLLLDQSHQAAFLALNTDRFGVAQ